MRKSQRWLEIQLKDLKRDKLHFQQASMFGQKLIQSSKKQLEVMEDNGRELSKLIPLLQQAATLIECSRVAQKGLSASLNHSDEWFTQSLNNSPGKRNQSSKPENHHIRQSSTQTQASSRLSDDVSSDCEGELRPWLNEHALVSEELHRLSADIVATFMSFESRGIVTDYDQLISGTAPISSKDDLNAGLPLAGPFSDHYDHLNDYGMYSDSVDRVTKTDKQNAHITQAVQGCCSPHICKRFQINS